MTEQVKTKKGVSLMQVFLIVIGAMFLTVLLTLFAIKTWLFPAPFQPVELSQKEEQQLEQKIQQFDTGGTPHRLQEQNIRNQPFIPQSNDYTAQGALKPEAYSEKGASREITFTERELNGLLANNTDLAQKMAIDLAADLVSLRLLIPIDPDFPIMGGKTLRVRAGAELAYRNNKPVVALKGISVMGVPIPNAWLGGIKNIDLMQEFGGEPGFWQSLGEGVESIQVRDGELYVKLKE
ncbi:MAG: arginine N-succinyltransferase [Candidatus Electrothrix sp. AW2]|nr:arginine N-succinyltransferase [Candidatus Electrothrix sp. AX1]MCI5117042.1 arginine N-succinyltransferase [Candidatus Electrothrix gigas]MCI5133928.1 arginine N-succinyltransferase [Candidatus Electrothrix gigas]MCI5179875.1 arginine N-succinyltransferase [Candidatus Electrothrix gigas]MCI5182855.1 arginine N-succinyltransferase [Candidatus Electrothrix gigas]